MSVPGPKSTALMSAGTRMHFSETVAAVDIMYATASATRNGGTAPIIASEGVPTTSTNVNGRTKATTMHSAKRHNSMVFEACRRTACVKFQTWATSDTSMLSTASQQKPSIMAPRDRHTQTIPKVRQRSAPLQTAKEAVCTKASGKSRCWRMKALWLPVMPTLRIHKKKKIVAGTRIPSERQSRKPRSRDSLASISKACSKRAACRLAPMNTSPQAAPRGNGKVLSAAPWRPLRIFVGSSTPDKVTHQLATAAAITTSRTANW
mmetsp:Transcript_7400/g.20998  ORF Transcript_7400/g.20998 Transcript_7400/m.20998 type:complete len:263 (-) Transcript_7400:1177-1965(-)